MFKQISDKVRLTDIEQEVLDRWSAEDVFRKSVESRQGGIDYTFYEGPPTANGRPGIHHVFARTIKDLVCRYWTMRGRQVHRKAGWDTHGLPVEIEVEKRLGLKLKDDIEKYGIDRFNAECRKSVFEYKAEWEELTRRMGYWVDMDHPYVTCENDYIESAWWALDRFFKGGMIYQDFKVQLYCPRCGTPLSSHEVSLGYRDVQDPSVYVKARIKDGGGAALLVWTTTPWTLISNVALAVNPEVTYVRVRHHGETLILAKDRLALFGSDSPEIEQEMPGRDLVGLEYERWFPLFAVDGPAWQVIPADFVTTEDGSGIVHMAPAYGEDDFQASRKHGLPMIQALDSRGRFLAEAGPYADMFFKDADPPITADLKKRGLLFRKETYAHSYPHCWRCETPLLFYARKSWYIRTTAYAPAMIDNNRKIAWHPPEVGEGRFGNWLEENKDWAISRDRYWGTPLPIWSCTSCDGKRSVGSVEELRRDGEGLREPLDLHKPFIDAVTLTCSCGGTMRRIPEVADVWFDSGSMPFAQWHYPFENQDLFKRAFPADFIAEGVDQTRGWFYTLHSISSFLFGVPCFKNVIVNELVLDKNGQKMSKTRGNTVNPFDVIGKYGADSVRWFLMAGSPPWKPKLFNEDEIGDAQRKFFGTLLNTYAFFALYANIDGFSPEIEAVPLDQRPDMDRWILSVLQSTEAEYIAAMDGYDPTRAARAVSHFTIEQLSNWYVRRNRRRFWKGVAGPDKTAAYQTLYTCLLAIVKMTAPLAPFLADAIYVALTEARADALSSVHLDWIPEPISEAQDPELEARMDLAQRIVGIVRSMRSRTNLRTRQPLARIALPVSGENRRRAHSMADVISDEVNVKAVEFVDEDSPVVQKTAAPNFKQLGPKFGKQVNAVAKRIRGMSSAEVLELDRTGAIRLMLEDTEIELSRDDTTITTQDIEGWLVETADGITVALDTTLTDELRTEGTARELVNRIQNIRKDAGLDVTDRIELHCPAPGKAGEALDRMSAYIQVETLATAVHRTPGGQFAADVDIDGEKFTVGISRTP